MREGLEGGTGLRKGRVMRGAEKNDQDIKNKRELQVRRGKGM